MYLFESDYYLNNALLKRATLIFINGEFNLYLEKYAVAVLVVGLTLLAGFCDSRGFLHASALWDSGRVVWPELMKSAAGYALGVLFYWLAIRFLPRLDLALSTEVQTLGWFCVTIVGVSLSSGELSKWSTVDILAAVLVIVGLGWLLFRGH